MLASTDLKNENDADQRIFEQPHIDGFCGQPSNVLWIIAGYIGDSRSISGRPFFAFYPGIINYTFMVSKYYAHHELKCSQTNALNGAIALIECEYKLGYIPNNDIDNIIGINDVLAIDEAEYICACHGHEHCPDEYICNNSDGNSNYDDDDYGYDIDGFDIDGY